jgi:hypothetical protein
VNLYVMHDELSGKRGERLEKVGVPHYEIRPVQLDHSPHL